KSVVPGQEIRPVVPPGRISALRGRCRGAGESGNSRAAGAPRLRSRMRRRTHRRGARTDGTRTDGRRRGARMSGFAEAAVRDDTHAAAIVAERPQSRTVSAWILLNASLMFKVAANVWLVRFSLDRLGAE